MQNKNVSRKKLLKYPNICGVVTRAFGKCGGPDPRDVPALQHVCERFFAMWEDQTSLQHGGELMYGRLTFRTVLAIYMKIYASSPSLRKSWCATEPIQCHIPIIIHLCLHPYTGWSINNRTILNCSHFVARRYFFNPFSPKRSIHTGKLPQQHEFANASFVILFRCHFVSPYHVDGSANNVLCRGGHFCEMAGVIAHRISSQVQLNRRTA